MIYKIKNRFTDEVIFEHDCDSMSACVTEAVKRKISLYKSNLCGTNLSGSNLYGANLYGANLYGSNLCGSNLSGSNLCGSNLSETNLSGAGLIGANLSGSNLYGSNLYGAKGIFAMGPSITGRIWYIYRHNKEIMINAGCRDFTLPQAREHWSQDAYSGWNEPNRNEINKQRLQWLDFIEAGGTGL